MRDRQLYCATCQKLTTFEAPPCAEGHDDCAELACTGCGDAILSAPSMLVRVPAAAPPTDEFDDIFRDDLTGDYPARPDWMDATPPARRTTPHQRRRPTAA